MSRSHVGLRAQTSEGPQSSFISVTSSCIRFLHQ
nr:MAG TPA: hypothetical protein [Caudoviricetes sp.]